jgi:hypothetical protein
MTERQYDVGNQDMYKLDREDHETANDAAEWFLGTRKPRTASEVRGILIKLYLKGMGKGIRLAKAEIEGA